MATASQSPDAAVDLDRLRPLAMGQPQRAITLASRWLADGLDAGREREVLLLMGEAAGRAGDEGARMEALLRLDTLAASDVIAGAYAGLLRAERLANLYQLTASIAESLRAAEILLASGDERLQALAERKLCDGYIMVLDSASALPHCERSSALWSRLGDGFERGRAHNLEGLARTWADQHEAAGKAFEAAIREFAGIGEPSLVSVVENNLTFTHLALGRAQTALERARANLAQDLRDGRELHANWSRLTMARALAALGDLEASRQQFDEAASAARSLDNDGQRFAILAARAEMEAASGSWEMASRAQKELIELLTRQRDQTLPTLVQELEARYASREQAMRIAELESAQQHDRLRLQQRRLEISFLLLGATLLAVVALLLLSAWRSQRRKAVLASRQALLDPLTGVANRRAFEQEVATLLSQPARADAMPALMLLDIDHFKKLNDRYGHPAGDEALRRVVAALRSALPDKARLARIGGEEFAVLLPAGPLSAAGALAEDLRQAVEAMHFEAGPVRVPVTVSIGLAPLPPGAEARLGDWLARADAALYEAKGTGRNRVVVAAEAG